MPHKITWDATRKEIHTHIPPVESAIAGACAGGEYSLSLFPADTVKSIMQTAEESRPRGKSVRVDERSAGCKGSLCGMRDYGCEVDTQHSSPSSPSIMICLEGYSILPERLM
ncbi:hypothetical protein F5141DRAFT_715254 [Pisolithus sp. B1]|nr:hypothetical protein F5141DRAFT_715254 [Pisolithus sp. B1]